MPNVTDNHFPLFWAYNRLGARLYGKEWTGQEYRATPQKSPEEMEKIRLPLEKQFSKVLTEISELGDRISREVKEYILDKLQASRSAAIECRNELREELEKLPRLDERYYEAWEGNERHSVTETRLIKALQNKEIEAWLVDGMKIEPRLWHGHPGFKWYLECSLAVMPETHYDRHKRRNMIVLECAKFENWLSGIIPKVFDEHSKPTETDQCKAFLRDAVKTGAKKGKKKDYFRQAQEQIPGLSRREFDRLWAAEVPKYWMRSGRPRG